MKEIRKAYCISELELAVLLSIIGKKQLYGYKIQAIVNAGEVQITHALFSLVRKGIMVPNGADFAISEEYCELIQGIKRADRLVVTADREQKFPELYLYLSDKAVVLQSYGQAGMMLKLEIWEKGEIAEQLMQYGFRIESSLQDESLYYEESIEQKEKASIFYSMNKTELLQSEAIRSVLLEMDIAQKKKIKQMLVLQNGLNDEIMIEDNEKMIRYFYSPKKTMEILNELIGG